MKTQPVTNEQLLAFVAAYQHFPYGSVSRKTLQRFLELAPSEQGLELARFLVCSSGLLVEDSQFELSRACMVDPEEFFRDRKEFRTTYNYDKILEIFKKQRELRFSVKFRSFNLTRETNVSELALLFGDKERIPLRWAQELIHLHTTGGKYTFSYNEPNYLFVGEGIGHLPLRWNPEDSSWGIWPIIYNLAPGKLFVLA